MARFIGTGDIATTVLGEALGVAGLADEDALVRELAHQAQSDSGGRERIAARAARLLEAVRADAARAGGLDDFLQRYGLASQEGVLLMCLAEALLRIPDAPTADALIADRVGRGNWRAHLDDSASLFVNASTWGLMLTGALLQPDLGSTQQPWQWLRSVVTRIGEPLARAALGQALRILAQQFVFGNDLPAALARAADSPAWECHSFDMLGEGALGAADARRHAEAYRDAIAAVGAGQRARREAGLASRDSVSVKLSALHPRYELAQRERVLAELLPLLRSLLQQAAQAEVALTFDAEECDRLELQLQLFAQLLELPAAGRPGQLGLAVQAYQKRAPVVIDWLAGLLRARQRHATVRLVKGAYWDSEIKRAQLAGLENYPVYTRKLHTDIAYLACARRLHAHRALLTAQYATHNAHTVAWIAELYGGQPVEFQRLHGMGEALYQALCKPVGEDAVAARCRVYAPVGRQSELLPYLVRRLLENGANTSFVHRAADRALPLNEVLRDPVAALHDATAPRPGLALPAQLCGPGRRCASGVDLHDTRQWRLLQRECTDASALPWRALPLVDGLAPSEPFTWRRNPARPDDLLGDCSTATVQHVRRAAEVAARAMPDWDAQGGAARAAILERAAGLFEAQRGALLARCVREAGRTVADSIAEWREAIDFLRYYAQQARLHCGEPLVLPGADGESNQLRLRGRGVFACISPWNFPLAIFTGQVAAALAAGNAVIAKPAEQTPLTAALAVELLRQAGVPPGVLQLLPGDGAIGAALTACPEVAGVAFTGSGDTAARIARALAARDGAIPALIAETGGLNVLLADSSALLPQLVPDALQSAFNSAGQRCSAARVLCVQRDIRDATVELLQQAMDELVVGDPALLETDIGPVIDADALAQLRAHEARLQQAGRILHRGRAPAGDGLFFAPLLAAIDRLEDVPGEIFGPVLHVMAWDGAGLPDVVAAINASGYGLTLGIHTRVESRAEWIAQHARVGNVYVNRNMIGAVVGMQPFGGCGRSGTGPKAGGPSYLQRFATEQCISVNTAAVGGNAALLGRE